MFIFHGKRLNKAPGKKNFLQLAVRASPYNDAVANDNDDES
jgi:hypothetical protein